LSKKDPKSIGEILSALMNQQTDLGKKLDQARIWEQWTSLAGPHLSSHGRPHAIKDKTLVVEVDGSVWMNRFAYYKWDILKRINLMYGEEIVSDIFIILTPEENSELGTRNSE